MFNFPFKNSLRPLYNGLRYSWFEYLHQRFASKLKNRAKINVVFFASNLSMWHYQHLVEEMKRYPKFNVYVVISPFTQYTNDTQKQNSEDLRSFFSRHNTTFMDSCDKKYLKIKEIINPEIVFYTQFYWGGLIPEHNPPNFKTKLLCAYPYGFNNIYADWAYNNQFQNMAWKLFYPNKSCFRDAQELAWNKGRNVVITGYPTADDFLSPEINNVWKKQNTKKERIIYAPHFTIERGCSSLFFSNFLKFHKLMQDIAVKYSDKIQFAFKPHPRLLTELYKHKDWGKEKADEYYKWWQTQENTQLEIGGFIDLFKTSDAMIHDCGSFSIEYFYTKNPVMFISRDMNEIKKQKNEVGIAALDSHYIGKNQEDIINFIENVVLNNNDTMKQQREAFFEKYLLPPNGKNVAHNTMDDILKSLNIQ